MNKAFTPPETSNHKNACKLSIIIVSFNTCSVTKDCIRSIYTSEWRDSFEIIVVDNNSSDGTLEMIREEFPNVRLIANPDNKLFSIANNQGARIASGEYLLLLNSDTIVEKDNIQKMINYFDTLPDDVICIGPKILNPDKTVQSRGFYQWGKAFQHFASLYRLEKILPISRFWPTLDTRSDKTHRTGWVSGSCMMIPRIKYLEVGGLNENLVFYGEEPEFGYRTDRLGYKTIYYADAYITHLGGVSSKSKQAEKYSFDKDMREYDSLCKETIGYRNAIRVTKRTIMSLRIKKLFYHNKDEIQRKIEHENKVVDYFRSKL